MVPFMVFRGRPKFPMENYSMDLSPVCFRSDRLLGLQFSVQPRFCEPVPILLCRARYLKTDKSVHLLNYRPECLEVAYFAVFCLLHICSISSRSLYQIQRQQPKVNLLSNDTNSNIPDGFDLHNSRKYSLIFYNPFLRLNCTEKA